MIKTCFQGVDNITSTHNQLYMWFKTDSSVAAQGFAFSWTSITPGVISQNAVVLYSYIYVYIV